MREEKKHPIQPLQKDEHGVMRFKQNQIICDILDLAESCNFGLNEISRVKYSREDRQQLAQLIGYSLYGYGSVLGYVDDDAFNAASAMAGGLDESDARITTLQHSIDSLRTALVAPMAELFGVHPDDLSANLAKKDQKP
jgi:hypothetical protein